MIGSCSDCGAEPVTLNYKPDAPLDEQDRPSICSGCRDRRNRVAEEGGF